jgi:hypothetical protein
MITSAKVSLLNKINEEYNNFIKMKFARFVVFVSFFSDPLASELPSSESSNFTYKSLHKA